MLRGIGYQIFRLFVALLPWGTTRTKWLIRYKIFKSVGENFYFCPRKIPADPKFIIFHNNVSVAADVVFCNHDVMYKTLNRCNCDFNEYNKYYGCIEVMDNVFIGAKTIILPNIRIGSNVIIGAGSIVTQDLESGGVYAGNPAKRIGDFSKVIKDRKKWAEETQCLDENMLQEFLWNKFYERRDR